jgi:hypothetical protein
LDADRYIGQDKLNGFWRNAPHAGDGVLRRARGHHAAHEAEEAFKEMAK